MNKNSKIWYKNHVEWKEHYENYPWIIKLLANKTNALKKDSSIECFQVKSFSEDRFEKKIGFIEKELLFKIHSTIAI